MVYTTCRSAPLTLNSEKIMRRVGNLGNILGLTPKGKDERRKGKGQSSYTFRLSSFAFPLSIGVVE